jgi:(E)-4-hydroxy-3-methylbut-2-enyl-diphosphate synthase
MNYDAHIILNEQTDYPLHIGITESGTNESGIIKSSVGIGALLLYGIGNTIRVSLTGDPVKEVLCAKEILEATGHRQSGINIISCPTCGRAKVDLEKIVVELTEKLEPIKKERGKMGKSRISVAVMGCIVNGPGEAKQADFGVACGDGKGAIFAKGEIITTVAENQIAETLLKIIINE